MRGFSMLMADKDKSPRMFRVVVRVPWKATLALVSAGWELAPEEHSNKDLGIAVMHKLMPKAQCAPRPLMELFKRLSPPTGNAIHLVKIDLVGQTLGRSCQDFVGAMLDSLLGRASGKPHFAAGARIAWQINPGHPLYSGTVIDKATRGRGYLVEIDVDRGRYHLAKESELVLLPASESSADPETPTVRQWCPYHLKWETAEEWSACDGELHRQGFRNVGGLITKDDRPVAPRPNNGDGE